MVDSRKPILFGLHEELGGRIVEFAGWSLPIQYSKGIVQEHLWCRERAALFDVSHMTQISVQCDGATEQLETVIASDLANLKPGQARYALLMRDDGGIVDDLIITRTGQGYFLVTNAARREADLAVLGKVVSLIEHQDRALLALQGPKSADILAQIWPETLSMGFMTSLELELSGQVCRVSRLGYTGEDGFEISLPLSLSSKFARTLLAFEQVEPVGLGARDSLRLEAGLCLYGQDIDDTTTPVEAGLTWTIGQRRMREGGFPGHRVVQRQLHEGVTRRRVGIMPEGRALARAGCLAVTSGGSPIGTVTSGGYAPSLGRPVSMAYIQTDMAEPGTEIGLRLRDKLVPANVVRLPFVDHRYHQKHAQGTRSS